MSTDELLAYQSDKDTDSEGFSDEGSPSPQSNSESEYQDGWPDVLYDINDSLRQVALLLGEIAANQGTPRETIDAIFN